MFLQPFLIGHIICNNLFACDLVSISMLLGTLLFFLVFNVKGVCSQWKWVNIFFMVPGMLSFIPIFINDHDMSTWYEYNYLFLDMIIMCTNSNTCTQIPNKILFHPRFRRTHDATYDRIWSFIGVYHYKMVHLHYSYNYITYSNHSQKH